MEFSKRDIKNFIVRGDLSVAVQSALEYAEYCHSADAANTLTGLSARLNDHQTQWTRGLISYDEFSRGHARIVHDLTSVLEELPNQPSPKAGKRKLLSETSFKKRLFYLLVGAKILVIARLIYHSNLTDGTGAFTRAETWATITILTPIFAAYLPVMLADYLRAYREDIAPIKRYVSGPLVTTSYWLLPLYAFALVYVIELKAKTDFSFNEMISALFVVETLIGGYVGQVVYGVFRRE